MACKHLHPNGSQDQKYSQCFGSNNYNYLAAKSVWGFEFFKQNSYIKHLSYFYQFPHAIRG
jgi:hypothetical protein